MENEFSHDALCIEEVLFMIEEHHRQELIEIDDDIIFDYGCEFVI